MGTQVLQGSNQEHTPSRWGGGTMETMPHKDSKKENGQRPHPESLTQRQNKAVQTAIQDQPTSRPARQKHKSKIKRCKGAFSFGLSGEAKGQKNSFHQEV